MAVPEIESNSFWLLSQLTRILTEACRDESEVGFRIDVAGGYDINIKIGPPKHIRDCISLLQTKQTDTQPDEPIRIST